MHTLNSIVGNAWHWAIRLAPWIFVLAFFGPILIGGPGAHQAPLGAIITAPVAIFSVFFIALLIQFRRAASLSTDGRFGYFVLLIILSVPTFYIVRMLGSIDTESYSSDKRLMFAPPLSEEESLRRKSTHFNIQVGVDNPLKFPEAYTRSLINDIEATRLFDRVKKLEHLRNADLIATIKAGYWGDQDGQAFTLHNPDDPTIKILVRVYYTPGGLMSTIKDRTQYFGRLSIEIIDAVNTIEALAIDSKSESSAESGFMHEAVSPSQ